MASEVAEAVLNLLTEEEIQSFYDPDAILFSGDLRELVKEIAPDRRARYSIKKCLKIAEEELEGIKEMPLSTKRLELALLLRNNLFRRRF